MASNLDELLDKCETVSERTLLLADLQMRAARQDFDTGNYARARDSLRDVIDALEALPGLVAREVQDPPPDRP